DNALKLAPPLREAYENDPRVKRLIDTARAIEGMPRHASTHAAGVVVTAQPVSHYVPLATSDEAVVTQFPMGTLEELGLLKMDFLGLRNLTVVRDTERVVRRDDPAFLLDAIPDDDAETFAMLAQGKTSGVFQLESAGMTGVCVGLVPQSIEDITAVVALYRPGPMDSIPRFIDSKHHPEHVTYKHPLLRDILRVTYGCIVYQEQVLEIFRKLAGFSLGKADMVRRAMSKKKMKELARERENFVGGNEAEGIPGAVKNGVDAPTAESIFDEIMDFANYAFNKAHAVSYAIVAYQTAYLKCHYPKEYMAALLTSVIDWTSKVAEYIAECREMGLEVKAPDINTSEAGFTVAPDGHIRFGLVAVKNAGRSFIQSLLDERAAGGPFASFPSFCARMYPRDLNRRGVESLIKCGAMDGFGAGRASLIAALGPIAAGLDASHKQNVEGQVDLFGGGGTAGAEAPLPVVPDYPVRERMTMEKEITGLYLSGHPLDAYRAELRKVNGPPLRRILNDFAQDGGPTVFRDEQKITVAGLLTAVRTKTTRNNSLMAYATLEDTTGSMELLVFANTLTRSGPYLKADRAVVVSGRLSVREDKEPQILADDVRPLADLDPVDRPPLTETPPPERKLYLKLSLTGHPKADRLRPLLAMFPGAVRAVIFDTDTGKKLGAACGLDDRLVRELTDWFGAENVVIQ
ncbi:MAG: DNA polymerase III subunit alpha, partial [Oscillospiraceae bacterium]|nr:DNA polymerase III subunit alpha [Oscillospiraceae bacterium]